MADAKGLRDLLADVEAHEVVAEKTEAAAVVVRDLHHLQELLTNYGTGTTILQSNELRDLKEKYDVKDPPLSRIFSPWHRNGSAGERLVKVAREGGIEIDTSASWTQVPRAVDRACGEVRSQAVELRRRVLERVESLTSSTWTSDRIPAASLSAGEVETAYSWLTSSEGVGTRMAAFTAERRHPGGGGQLDHQPSQFAPEDTNLQRRSELTL